MAKSGLGPAEMAYSKMVTAIRGAVTDGSLQPGHRLPSESQLADMYGISVTSVRRGVEILVNEGLVVRRQGSGTYVTDTPPATTRKTVLDTVSVILPLKIRGDHPFYSEMQNGIAEGLTDIGWKVWEYEMDFPADASTDMANVPLDPEAVARQLAAHKSLAGALMGASLAEQVAPHMNGRIPVVVPDPSENFPYAMYDWEHEIERALRMVIRAKRKRVLLLSQYPEKTALEIAERAAQAEGVRRKPEFVVHESMYSGLCSEVVRASYEGALSLFEDEGFDAAVVGSDFETQGVLDALERLDRSIPDDVYFIGVVNRESRIHSRSRVTTLEIDGYAHGVMLAKLLDEHIRTPSRARRRVWLSGTLHCAY